MTDRPAPAGTDRGTNRLDDLARHGGAVSAGVGAGGVLFLLYCLWRVVRLGFSSALGPVFAWALACAAVAGYVATARWVVRRDERTTEGERLRFRLLVLGGGLGLLTALLGLALPFTTYYETFSGGLKQWRENPAALVWTAAALFGGLTLTFVSLQLTRGVERTSSSMRQFLYGYNAVLTTLVLAIILGLVNVLAYSRVGPFNFFTTAFDWTTGGVYTLSDGSKNLLANLKQPVKVYVLLTREDRASDHVETLLSNCRAVTDQISWESLSRDLNRKAIAQLAEKYQIPEAYGLLVVYGTEPNTTYDFIKYEDLVSEPGLNPRGGQASSKFTFKGENALVKSIVYLSEGKSKAVVYFTQGNGELDANDRGRGRDDSGIGALRDRVARANYDVKDLKLGLGTKAVPEDAAVVVVARPGGFGQPMAPDAVQALRDYLAGTGRKNKGTLVVLLDVVAQRDGRMAATGLEALLAEYGVKANNDRVISVQTRPPTYVLGVANSRSNNPVAAAFSQGSLPVVFGFDDVRTVTAAPAAPGGRFNAETLIQTIPGAPVWAETDLAADPVALVSKLRSGPREELIKKLTPGAENPLPLAVAVTEGGGPDPSMPPGHPSVGREGKPRLVVFGDAFWVTNGALAERTGDNNYELFSNCLSWLRERPDVGRQAPDKEREDYSLTLTEDQSSRVKLLPAGLMLAAVLGLAGGVWVVRRR